MKNTFMFRGRVARIGRETVYRVIWLGNMKERVTSQDIYVGVDRRIILTLRLLMSYIYIYIYIYMEHLFLMFLYHTQRRSTVGRTPLDE